MRRTRLGLGLVLTHCILAGCVSSNLPAAGVRALVPAASTSDCIAAKQATASVAACEPTAARTEPLTVDDAIRRCLLADPQIQSGVQAVLQADAELLAASLPPNPSLWTDLQLMPLTRPFTVTEQGGPPQYDLHLSYQIDWWLFGKRAAAMASAQLGQQVSQAELADLVRQRTMQCALAYYDLQEANAIVQVVAEALSEMEPLTRPVAAAVAAGQLSAAEGKAFDLALLKNRQDVADAEVGRKMAQAKLATFLAEPGRSVGPISFLPQPPVAVSWPTLEEAFQVALRNRPDLESLRQKVAQAQADCKVEEVKAYPEVTPTIGYTRQFQRKSIGFPDADSWAVALELTLPFCNRNEGARAKAVALAAQAQSKLEAAELELRAELEGLLAECANAAAAEVNAVRQVELTREISRALRATPGEIDLKIAAELLVALREHQEARKNLVTRRANFWRAWWKPQAALGQQLPTAVASSSQSEL